MRSIRGVPGLLPERLLLGLFSGPSLLHSRTVTAAADLCCRLCVTHPHCDLSKKQKHRGPRLESTGRRSSDVRNGAAHPQLLTLRCVHSVPFAQASCLRCFVARLLRYLLAVHAARDPRPIGLRVPFGRWRRVVSVVFHSRFAGFPGMFQVQGLRLSRPSAVLRLCTFSSTSLLLHFVFFSRLFHMYAFFAGVLLPSFRLRILFPRPLIVAVALIALFSGQNDERL